MVLHQMCKVSSLFRSLLLFLLCACSFLHCLFVCVSMPTYKRSTGEVVPCKILKVNQDGTMSIEYLRNGMSLPPPPGTKKHAPPSPPALEVRIAWANGMGEGEGRRRDRIWYLILIRYKM